MIEEKYLGKSFNKQEVISVWQSEAPFSLSIWTTQYNSCKQQLAIL